MNSIEWLIEKLGWNNRSDAINRIVDEANEMHKQEILDAFEEGSSDGFYGWGSSNKEKYYTETFKKFSLMDETPSAPASDSTMMIKQETLYTEEQIKLAYMQGYNRGKDGNPNHMESYIQFLKQPKQ